MYIPRNHLDDLRWLDSKYKQKTLTGNTNWSCISHTPHGQYWIFFLKPSDVFDFERNWQNMWRRVERIRINRKQFCSSILTFTALFYNLFEINIVWDFQYWTQTNLKRSLDLFNLILQINFYNTCSDNIGRLNATHTVERNKMRQVDFLTINCVRHIKMHLIICYFLPKSWGQKKICTLHYHPKMLAEKIRKVSKKEH